MAKRAAAARCGFGVVVRYDQSDHRGGDSWDQRIRRQITECALFIPVISENTQSQGEGYFRLEWKLAVVRTHDTADHAAFPVPVELDGTSDREVQVPDRFRAAPWTCLPGGETPAAFARQDQGARAIPTGETTLRASGPGTCPSS